MQGTLKYVSKGKLSRFILASNTVATSGQDRLSEHAAKYLATVNAADVDKPKSSSAGPQETPLAILARRRDKSGKAFLSRALVAAGQRLREDFEIGKLASCDHGTWDQCLLDAAPEAALSKDPRQREAIAHVAAALSELGPGLGDVALKCCCYLEGLEVTEQSLGWSARSGKIVLRAASKGTGIIAGGPVRAVCEVLGVKDIVAKSMGTSNAHNVIRATMKALLKQNSPKQISSIRNKKISEIIEKRG